MPQFTRSDEHIRCELHGEFGDWLSLIAVDGAKQFAHPSGVNDRAAVGNGGTCQRPFHVTCRIGLEASRGDRIAKHQANELERSARAFEFGFAFDPANRDHGFTGCIAPPAGLAQADFGVRPDRQLLLAAIDPVLEPPQFSAARLDQQEQAMGVAHLIRLRTRLSISDDHIGKCHDFNPPDSEWPPKSPEATGSMETSPDGREP